MMSEAGATGFEPAISCLTGRYVKPGYTTPPLTTPISYHKCRARSNPYCQRNVQLSLGGPMGTSVPVPGTPDMTLTRQVTVRSAPSIP